MKKSLIAIFAVLLLAICIPATGFAAALLIEDVTPWDGDGISNAETLAALGIPYTKISSSQLAATDLSAYQFVSYASVQPMTYYANIEANLTKISNYVVAGGILVAHSCIWGWNGYDTYWKSGNFLPGGVGHNGTDDPGQGYYSNSVSILDLTHPVIDGPYGVVAEASLQDWNWSTHGYFTNLVAGTEVVIGVLDASNVMQPAYIEYSWGAGEVRATMMTLEWAMYDPAGSRHIFRENEYYYAAHGVPEPGTLLLLGAGLIGLVGLRRKLGK